MSFQQKLQQVKDKTTYGYVLKYTSLFGGVQGVKMLASLVRNKITARLLGTAGAGLIGVYNSMTEFIVSCTNFGLPLSATRETSSCFEHNSQDQLLRLVCVIRTWAVWTSALAVLVCLLLSPVLSYVFFDYDTTHWAEVLLLLPIVVALLVAEAECSILKGVRQLRRVATLESIVALTTLLFTVPFYYFFGMKGVIFGLVTSTIVACAVHLSYSVPLFPYQIRPFSREVFAEGLPLIKKGIPYALAGLSGAAVSMLIPALILYLDSLSDFGLYRSGFALLTAFSGVAFVALETDYYPRLSAARDFRDVNSALNQQVDVCLMLITPFLILFLLFMPTLIRLLLTEDFLGMHGMMLFASFYIFLRGIILPYSYIPLSRGDSKIYLFVEVLSGIVTLACVGFCFKYFGITGAGIALSAGAIFDTIVCLFVYGRRYHCALTPQNWMRAGVQLICLALTVVICFVIEQSALKYVLVTGVFMISGLVSLLGLRKKMKKPEC